MALEFKSSFDDSAFTAGLRRMWKATDEGVKKISGGFTNVKGQIAALGIGVGVKSVLDFAGGLQDSATALGINVEQLQGFGGAMAQTGVTQEKFAGGMTKLTKALQEARDGNEGAIENFKRLGVSIGNIASDDPAEILLKMADGMKNSANSTESFAAAMGILGKSGQGMIASLKEGRDAFQAQADAVSKLSAQEIADLDAAGDAWTRFGNKAKVAAGQALVSATSGGLWAAMTGQKISTGGPVALVDEMEARAAVEARKARNKTAEGINESLGAGGQSAKEIAEIEAHNEKIRKATDDFNRDLAYDRAKEAEKESEKRLKAEMDDEKEYTEIVNDEFEKRYAAKEKAAKDALKAEREAEKEFFQQQLDDKRDAQQAAQSALGGAEDAFGSFSRSSADERREANRSAARERREAGREERMRAKPWQDARAGAGRLLRDIADKQKDVKLADESVKQLVEAINKLVLAA